MKKLLLCIGISILITSFIGTTFLFLRSMTGYANYVIGGYTYNHMNVKDLKEGNSTNETLDENNTVENNAIEEFKLDNVEKVQDNKEEIKTFEDYKLEGRDYDYVVGKTMEEMINSYEEQSYKENGDEFPTIGYLVCTLLLYRPLMIIRIYLISIITGIIIGCIVDLLFVKKIKGSKLVSFFAILFVIFFILIRGLDVCDSILVNIANGNNATDFLTYQYGFVEIFIGYGVIFSILYIICMLHQKLIARKLNKELNKL